MRKAYVPGICYLGLLLFALRHKRYKPIGNFNSLGTCS